eukprot:TRINITY_DN123023_c0_g1_i1.p1 TRINITY_DN123023_c0_g1~~TRINITY_DN123023_c0_g1_i1.p1  ORF type:complete len:255 (-),score=76.97 TRINITY_DN123023_c0_g1_i1:132-896(-)
MGNHLAKNTVRRAKKQKEMREANDKFMTKFDKSHTGTLSRAEVKNFIAEIVHGGAVSAVTEDEVELVMRLGGNTCAPEISAQEVPLALAIMATLKEYSDDMDKLFLQFDKDKTGSLDASQLKALLMLVNDGLAPSTADVDYVLRQCEPRGKADPIHRDQLKPAIACWYCLKAPTSDKIKELFRTWDTAGNGVITKQEMEVVMKRLHPGMTQEELDIVFKSTDKNGNGVLEYNEFVDWVMSGSDPALKTEANTIA